MREYGKVIPRFWTSGTGRRLRGDQDAQIIALYLMSCPSSSITGIFHLALPTVAHETGCSLERTRAAIGRLAALDFAHYDEEEELVWVVTMAAVQVGETLKPRDNRIEAIRSDLAHHRRHPFAAKFLERYAAAFHLESEIEAPSKPLRSPFEAPSKGGPSPPSKPEAEAEAEAENPNPLPARDLTVQEVVPVRPAPEPAWTASVEDVPERFDAVEPFDPPAMPPPLEAEPVGAGRAYDWYQAFAIAWARSRNVLQYGRGISDAKAQSRLSELLESLPPDDGAAAWAKRAEIISRFLADDDPRTVRAGHPFAFFQASFNALRTAHGPPASSAPRRRPREADDAAIDAWLKSAGGARPS